MNDFSLVEKINILMKTISSSPLFLICSLVAILFLIFLIICIIKNKKINKIFLISIVVSVVLIILISYGSILFNIINAIIDRVFMILYFPDLITYFTVVVISNIIFIISIINRNLSKVRKIINIVCPLIIDLFLIFIIDIISKNNINFYESVTLYTNSTLLVLLQLSMGIFISGLLLNLFCNIYIRLKKYDEPVYPKMQEIIFDD